MGVGVWGVCRGVSPLTNICRERKEKNYGKCATQVFETVELFLSGHHCSASALCGAAKTRSHIKHNTEVKP